MTSADQPHGYEPRWPLAIALVIFILAALSLCHPMLTGQFLAGDDQLIAGFGFRQFGAEYFRTHGRIPEWNPYLFGGMPFIAAMHGDIFYPTAWLRWLIPTDIGMTLGFFVHLVIAGTAMYALVRALGVSWGAAVAAGIGYELSGILASMMNNGHDGKLFVAALAPFAFLSLIRGIREGRLASFGIFALIIGLCMLSPHYQMTYYLLVASGLFALWLTFLDRERAVPKSPVRDLGLSVLAVALGVGIGMIQGLPFLKYIPFSPRVEGGDSSGWEYATSYAMPVEELASTVMPHFNGMLDHYWGGNFFKSHTEYLGALVVILAVFGLGVAKRRGLLTGFGIVAGLFLLVSFGGHTPFYRLWYEVMPMMQKVRAAGMAFFLVALPVCVWAALGADRLLRGEVSRKQLLIVTGVIAGFAVLGVIGALQPVAEAIATGIQGPAREPDMALTTAMENADMLRSGALRLLIVTVVGGAAMFAIRRGSLRGLGAALALAAVVLFDHWSVMRHFAKFIAPASVTYGDDDLIRTMKQAPLPYRTYEPSGAYGGAAVYQGAWLMASHVPSLFGYHGNESRFFDELWGTKNIWQNQLSPTLLDLYGVRFIAATEDVSTVFAGFHKVMGPTSFPNLWGRRARAGFLFERDSTTRWARVVPFAAKAPDSLVAPTVADPRFPLNSVVVFSDTASIDVAAPSDLTARSAVTATVSEWDAGRMTITLAGRDSATSYLVVAENWYPGWTATVDGQPAPVLRANHAMIGVPIPGGAQQVVLAYETPGYGTGMMITLASLVGAVGIVVAGRFGGRTRVHG